MLEFAFDDAGDDDASDIANHLTAWFTATMGSWFQQW
jgi:hypothetical protein